MKQVKNCVPRASALFLACFVVAFSVSVPAAAAEVTPTQLTGTVEYSAVAYYTNDTYDRSETSTIEYPVYDNATIKQVPLDAGKYIKYMITQMEFDDVPLNVPLRIHVIFQGYWPYVTLNPRCNMRYYAGSAWHVLNYTTVSTSFSNEGGSWRYDLVADFSLPLEATQLRLQGIVQPTVAVEVDGGYSSNQSFRLLEFSAMDPIVDQTPADKAEADRIDGSVTDKNNQTDNISDRIEALDKPTVGTNSSGNVVIGGMQVDPMGQVDQQSFSSLTNVIGTIFGSTTILSYFVIVFSMIFVSYVIFGKS